MPEKDPVIFKRSREITDLLADCVEAHLKKTEKETLSYHEAAAWGLSFLEMTTKFMALMPEKHHEKIVDQFKEGLSIYGKISKQEFRHSDEGES